jgi:hypothetical protein
LANGAMVRHLDFMDAGFLPKELIVHGNEAGNIWRDIFLK